MPASPADSALYRHLFSDDEVAALFTDSAEIRALMLVEGTLAKVQGALGLIPADAAAYLHRASFELQIDPSGLAQDTATNGVPIPALVAAFRKACEAPEHAAYLHWGATSQDIMDTALALRLRRMLAIFDTRLNRLISALGQLAADHAETAMAARTFGQTATPTTFGAVVASWGRPLLHHRAKLPEVTAQATQVSLSGAAGTLSAMGDQGPQVREALAKALHLTDPGASWHTDRSGVAALSAWLTTLTTLLAKMGEDLILLTQSGINEVTIAGAGASSTMPQKQNPVAPSVLSAIARQAIVLNSALQGATIHRQQRDGAAWFTEWLSLPQLCILSAKSLALATDLAQRIHPNPDAMQTGLDAGHGVIFAEALTFALAAQIPRPEAQAKVKSMCLEAASGTHLLTVAGLYYPDIDWPQTLRQNMLGQAPAEARAFAKSARG